MKRLLVLGLSAVMVFTLVACGNNKSEKNGERNNSAVSTAEDAANDKVSVELEYISDEYRQPSEHQGKLERLTYQTWESFSYEEKSQELTKEAWVYIPYGYSEEKQYNIFYISHGGWSNETTLMGTSDNPKSFKNVIDNAIETGEIQPLILVFPTYNNTSIE